MGESDSDRGMDRKTKSSPLLLEGLGALPRDKYRGVLLDQFGVLHDGNEPYDGAIEAVKFLKEELELKILIVSNSSRRANGALSNLERMGFPVDAFFGVITSGEMTHLALEEKATPFWSSRHRCLHFTWASRAGSQISLKGLGLEVVDDPALADTIIAHGTEAISRPNLSDAPQPRSLEELRSALAQAARRSDPPPLVVANPDVVTVQGSELRTMPGTLARWYYEMMEGKKCGMSGRDLLENEKIVIMGKPDRCIYDMALKMLRLSSDEVLAIGDSLEHDILGAYEVDIDSIFIGGGIHAKDLGLGTEGGKDENTTYGRMEIDGSQRLFSRYDVQPRYMMTYFTR